MSSSGRRKVYTASAWIIDLPRSTIVTWKNTACGSDRAKDAGSRRPPIVPV